MAKKVQSMREKKATEDDRNSKKRQSREYRGRSSRHRQREAEKFDENPVVNQNREENPASNFALSPLLSERQAMNTSQEDQVMQDQMTTAMAQVMPSSRWTDSRKSPDKVSRDSGVTSPSEAGVSPQTAVMSTSTTWSTRSMGSRMTAWRARQTFFQFKALLPMG